VPVVLFLTTAYPEVIGYVQMSGSGQWQRSVRNHSKRRKVRLNRHRINVGLNNDAERIFARFEAG